MAPRIGKADANCPVVQIMETGPAPYDRMIGFSHYEATMAATAHLLAQGYRNPGFLGARMDPRTQRRLKGFRDALCEHGLAPQERRLRTTTHREHRIILCWRMTSWHRQTNPSA